MLLRGVAVANGVAMGVAMGGEGEGAVGDEWGPSAPASRRRAAERRRCVGHIFGGWSPGPGGGGGGGP